jgi:thioredoxin 1
LTIVSVIYNLNSDVLNNSRLSSRIEYIFLFLIKYFYFYFYLQVNLVPMLYTRTGILFWLNNVTKFIPICGHKLINTIWVNKIIGSVFKSDYYSFHYLSFISYFDWFIEIQTITMDTITSTSASLTLSLPTVPVRTVASSISVSSSLFFPRSHCSARQRLYSQKRRFWNSSCSSAVPKFTVTCGITEINESQFKETVLKSERPVLVEFVATWCSPCRLITPAMESLAQVFLSFYI